MRNPIHTMSPSMWEVLHRMTAVQVPMDPEDAEERKDLKKLYRRGLVSESTDDLWKLTELGKMIIQAHLMGADYTGPRGERTQKIKRKVKKLTRESLADSFASIERKDRRVMKIIGPKKKIEQFRRMTPICNGKEIWGAKLVTDNSYDAVWIVSD